VAVKSTPSSRPEGRHRREVRSTYFGGPNEDESGYDGGNIKVDRCGNIWLAGITMSPDLPTTNAPQSRFGGGEGDGFIAAFSPDLKEPLLQQLSRRPGAGHPGRFGYL
jgi:hypothetical protein